MLMQFFGGSASNLVHQVYPQTCYGAFALIINGISVYTKRFQANHSAVELVRLIVAYFPGFRDEAIFLGRQVDKFCLLGLNSCILYMFSWLFLGFHIFKGLFL